MLIPVRYNIRYLIRRWPGTLMITLTFALVVAVFIIVMALAQGLERALKSTGEPLNVIVMRQGSQSESQSSVDIQRYQIVRNYRGISKDAKDQPLAAPEILVLVNKPKNPDGKPTNLQIRGVHPLAFAIRSRLRIVEGRRFRPGLREVIVSRSVSQRFQHMGIGDKPFLGKGKWTIVGIFDANGTAYDSEMWADCQEIMQEFDRVAYSTVMLRAIDKAAADDLIKRIDEDPQVKLKAQTEDAYYAEQTTTAMPIKAFGYFLAVVMSIGACFAGMNTMYSNISNRVREIATLRVLGFSPFSVILSFLMESIALALIGGAFGCAASLPINGLATGTTNFQTFSEVVFYFSITPRLMARGMIFAAIMGAVGGLMPAISAAREPILRAIRRA